MTNQKLILQVESKVISANTAEWEAEQKAFLSGLTEKFETDEDFANAKAELKEIEAREKAAKIALDAVVNGSQDVSTLIDNVGAVIEDLRQARLGHSKIIKAKEASRKQEIIDEQIARLDTAYKANAMFLKPLQASIPFDVLSKRLYEAAKNKRTIDSTQAAVYAETNACIAELTAELTRLEGRYADIPKDRIHLFNDALTLIVGTDDIKTIVEQRIKEDDERQAAEKARIEAEAKAKAERQAEQAQADKTKHETVKQPPEPQQQTQPDPVQQSVTEPTNEQEAYTLCVNDVVMHVYGDLDKVKPIAKCLKENFETVRLTKGANQ